MRLLIRAAAVAAAFAVPTTVAAPPASAALVCVYWTTRPVWTGGPAGEFWATYPSGVDTFCTVAATTALVDEILEHVEHVET